MRTSMILACLVLSIAPAAADPAVAFHVDVVDGRRTLVIDTPIDVHGRPPAPAVAVLTPPLQIDYHWPTEIDSFVPHIIASVRQAAFAAVRPAASAVRAQEQP